MGRPLFVVDAFTDRPFAGNPAAVCVLSEDADDAWLAGVAREMNLSETAFLRRAGDVWKLRWFTPAVEVDLCGHATLASAHALWETGLADAGRPIRFETKSGPLGALSRAGKIELDFPAEPPAAAPAPEPPVKALRLPASSVDWCGRNRLDYLLELDSERSVRQVAPDLAPTRSRCEARFAAVTASSAFCRAPILRRTSCGRATGCSMARSARSRRTTW